MPAGITATDNMFSVREATWHGLETAVLEDYPDRKTAQAISMPWEVVQEPLYRKVPIINPDNSLSESYEETPKFVANVRDDNNALLGVVSDGLELVKNNDLWDISEIVQGNNVDVKWETAGSLDGGKRVWVLLRLDEPITIKGDPRGETLQYYALQNNHDGLGSFRGQATAVRIVCANTAQLADMDAANRGTEFVFHHTKNIASRIEEAKTALAGWRDSVITWRLQMETLASMHVEPDQVSWFVEEFIPMPAGHTTSERVVTHVEEARGTLRSILDGITCEGINDNAYGLVQASVEYQEHYRKARSMESRFKRAMLSRNQVVADAVELAMASVKV